MSSGSKSRLLDPATRTPKFFGFGLRVLVLVLVLVAEPPTQSPLKTRRNRYLGLHGLVNVYS